MSALKVLLAHERPELAGDVPDTDAILRQLAADPSVSGQARMRALERVLEADEQKRRDEAAANLAGPDLDREADGAAAALVVAAAMRPNMPSAFPQLYGVLRSIALGQLVLGGGEPVPHEPAPHEPESPIDH